MYIKTTIDGAIMFFGCCRMFDKNYDIYTLVNLNLYTYICKSIFLFIVNCLKFVSVYESLENYTSKRKPYKG